MLHRVGIRKFLKGFGTPLVMNLAERVKGIYTQHSKKLLILPVLLMLLTIASLIYQVTTYGDIFNKDVSLAGGISATIATEKPVDIVELERVLDASLNDATVKRVAEFGSDKQIGIIIEVPEMDEMTLKQALEQELAIQLTDENYSIEVAGSAVGATFYQQMVRAMIFSLIFMAIVVFVVFRSFIPGVAAVLSALFDILVTIAIINVIGVKISAAGIAAFLMLIGYSIDTDILQTTRVLKKREPTPVDGVVSSIKTGLTMTITSFVAVALAYFLSTSTVFKEMFLIISIGLIVDVIMTYCMNAPLLLAYANKKMQPQNA